MIDLIVIIVGHLNICNGLEMVWTLIGYVLMGLPIIATFIIILIGLIKGMESKKKLIEVLKEILLKAIVIFIIFNVILKLLMIGGKYLIDDISPNSCVRCVFDINGAGCGINEPGVLVPTEE